MTNIIVEPNETSSIDVYYQDEVCLDTDLSLLYIRSGEKELKDYVETVSKPDIESYTNEYAKPLVSQAINDMAGQFIEKYVTTATTSATVAETSAKASANSAELSKQYANDKINQTNITNCITEIPQDIKLELVNGVLTLKAGSKVYVPNGTGKFDIKNISNDVSFTYSGGVSWYVFIASHGGLDIRETNNVFSGDTAPTGLTGFNVWYDTVNNLVKKTPDGGVTWSDGISLPIATISVSNGVISSIDQIFNGFGYIGSTAFSLPGIKGLLCNGRNDDGSLKSIEFTTNHVSTINMAKGVNFLISVHADSNLSQDREERWLEQVNEPENPISGSMWYSPKTNLLKQISNGVWLTRPKLKVVKFFVNSNGRVTLFQSKQAFRATDYNDIACIKDYIVERGTSGNQWYELYQSKRLRQGGYSQSGTITFLKPYANSNYTLINGSSKTTTGFSAGSNAIDWYSDGQGA